VEVWTEKAGCGYVEGVTKVKIHELHGIGIITSAEESGVRWPLDLVLQAGMPGRGNSNSTLGTREELTTMLGSSTT
jgi:hypothetical protein